MLITKDNSLLLVKNKSAFKRANNIERREKISFLVGMIENC